MRQNLKVRMVAVLFMACSLLLLVLIIGCWINIYLLSRLVTMGHLLSVLIIVLVFSHLGLSLGE